MRNYQKITSLLGVDREALSRNKVSVGVNRQLSYDQLVLGAFSSVDFQYSQQRVERAHEYVKEIADGNQAVYGITTSFGGNIKNVIPPVKSHLLQHNLVTSHAANVGTYIPYEICKAVVISRILMLAKGYSGISSSTLELMLALLETGIIPAIPAHGSMGASGDLGPLSAIAHTMIGEGQVYLPDGKTVVPTRKALRKYKLTPVTLHYREGLALINGTAVMTSVGSFYLWYLRRLIENSLVVGAMSAEALRSSKEPFDKTLHELKPHRYQINVARVMRSMLRDSKLALSHRELKREVEKNIGANGDDVSKSKYDLQGGSYSLRAIPQIYQPILELYQLLKRSIDTEINAVDDNPLVLADKGKQLHGANFHGHPVSVTADSMNLALVSVANTSNSRLDRMLKPHHTGLPSFLATGQEGLYLGIQGLQYTAAGICAELRSLAHPLSTNQITTNNDNQDMVSFGLQANLKGMEMTVLAGYVLAAEYIAATQALWLRFQRERVPKSALSSVTRQAYDKLLKIYSPIEDTDQSFTEVVENVSDFLLLENLLPEPLQRQLWRD